MASGFYLLTQESFSRRRGDMADVGLVGLDRGAVDLEGQASQKKPRVKVFQDKQNFMSFVTVDLTTVDRWTLLRSPLLVRGLFVRN